MTNYEIENYTWEKLDEAETEMARAAWALDLRMTRDAIKIYDGWFLIITAETAWNIRIIYLPKTTFADLGTEETEYLISHYRLR